MKSLIVNTFVNIFALEKVKNYVGFFHSFQAFCLVMLNDSTITNVE